jgi:acetylornithine aminotransferase
LLGDIAAKGEYLLGKLAYFRKYRFVKDVRGIGLLQSIELDEAINGNYVTAQMMQAGVLVNCTKKNIIRLLPPYTITYAEIDILCEKLDEIFRNTNL